MDKTEGIGYSVSGFMTLLTALQAEELFRYIQLGISILVGVVTLIYTIVKLIKVAKADDGKIDAEEAKEIAKTAIKGGLDLKDKIDDQLEKGKETDKNGGNHLNY